MLFKSLLLLLFFNSYFVVARLFHSLPDDLYAFPKYRVTFLNGLPLLNETAERWLREGLRGGEAEFLDHPTPWEEPSPFKHIDSGESATAAVKSISDYTIELMKMGSRDTYLCFTPPPIKQDPPPPEETITEVTRLTAGRFCNHWTELVYTYHRQGWFTYAYCHNSHVRQFRELIHPRPMTPGKMYEIEEDPDWEAYDLGRAPESSPGADLSRADHGAVAANLELARGAGSRYLVQRWGDGTLCDKTGKRREIEVQFHCSMTMTDNIMFVKETKTCNYILVINTPRLCGEPGFKSRVDQRDEALIRCRQVVDATTLANADSTLPESDHPFLQRRASANKPPPPLDAAEATSGAGASQETDSDADADDGSHKVADNAGALGHSDLLRRALEAILQRAGNPPGEGAGAAPRVVVEDVGGGEMMIEFISEVAVNDEGDLEQRVEDLSRLMDPDMFEAALREAGFDVRDEEVEVEVGVEAEAEREEEERRQRGERTVNGAAKGYLRRANAHPMRDEM
ncbi:hypothetical protein BJV78DRAFT_1150698 [Lactifluus subvellereus]|nr:hypothetical protein BJV78DRAFT_1150698 [Lactifluus subvellereus]